MSADQPPDDQSFDGRAAVCCFALGLWIGALALLERMGVAALVIRSLMLFGVLGGLVVIATLQRTMRVSRFYAGGRAVPASYAALALAGLLAAVAVPLLPATQTPTPTPLPRPVLGVGLPLGGVYAGLLTGPLLRKSGAFSIPDLIAARFPSLPLRLAVIGITAVSAGLVGLAAFQSALTPLLAAVDMGRPLGAALLAGVVMLVIVPGGLGGAVWAAAGSAIILFAGLLLPFVLAGGSAGPAPFAEAEARFSAAAQGLAQWEAMPQRFVALDPAIGLALTLGVGVLVPLLGPAIACVSTAEAQRAGRRALGLGLALIALAGAFAGRAAPDMSLVSTTLVRTAEVTVELGLAAAAVQALAVMMGHDLVHRMRDATALTSRRLAITRAVAIAVLVILGLRVGAGAADPVPLIGLAIWLSAGTLAPLLMLALWPQASSRDAAVALVTACAAAGAALLAGGSGSTAPRFAVSALVACATGLIAGLVTSTLRRDPQQAGAAFVRAIMRDTAEFPRRDRGA